MDGRSTSEPGPLAGTRVVELGVIIAGPATAAILGDWGADVIKVEPPGGDVMRSWYPSAPGRPNAPFAHDNRGKRGVALDLHSPAGHEAMRRLLATADVFVTNLRPGAVARLGLSHDDLADDFPRLVHCDITGYGATGPAADRAAFDIGAVWARSGVGATLRREGEDVPAPRGGMGDHMTALAAVGAICAALAERERTGRGRRVSTSLMRTGIYMMSWDVSFVVRGEPYQRAVPRRRADPLHNCYATADGRWLWVYGGRHQPSWPGVCRAVGRPEWIEDPRYATPEARKTHAEELVAALDVAFAAEPLARFAPRLDAEGVRWEPLQDVEQVVEDPVAQASGAFVDDGGDVPVIAAPVDFDGAPRPTAPRQAPDLGEHTVEVLRELGYDDAGIAAVTRSTASA